MLTCSAASDLRWFEEFRQRKGDFSSFFRSLYSVWRYPPNECALSNVISNKIMKCKILKRSQFRSYGLGFPSLRHVSRQESLSLSHSESPRRVREAPSEPQHDFCEDLFELFAIHIKKHQIRKQKVEPEYTSDTSPHTLIFITQP